MAERRRADKRRSGGMSQGKTSHKKEPRQRVTGEAQHDRRSDFNRTADSQPYPATAVSTLSQHSLTVLGDHSTLPIPASYKEGAYRFFPVRPVVLPHLTDTHTGMGSILLVELEWCVPKHTHHSLIALEKRQPASPLLSALPLRGRGESLPCSLVLARKREPTSYSRQMAGGAK
jgi:hypothetical protein